jgi:hypothetical protein
VVFWPFGFFVRAKVITAVKDPCKRLWMCGLFWPCGFFVEAKVITVVKDPCKRLWWWFEANVITEVKDPCKRMCDRSESDPQRERTLQTIVVLTIVVKTGRPLCELCQRCATHTHGRKHHIPSFTDNRAEAAPTSRAMALGEISSQART